MKILDDTCICVILTLKIGVIDDKTEKNKNNYK